MLDQARWKRREQAEEEEEVGGGVDSESGAAKEAAEGTSQSHVSHEDEGECESEGLGRPLLHSVGRVLESAIIWVISAICYMLYALRSMRVLMSNPPSANQSNPHHAHTLLHTHLTHILTHLLTRPSSSSSPYEAEQHWCWVPCGRPCTSGPCCAWL